MLKKRLIATLLIKDELIVQSFNFNRYLPIGRPKFPIEFVSRWDVDEIILLDMSASPNNKLFDLSIVEMVSKYCFVPLTIGGGIEDVKDVKSIIRSGADKVSLNTNALKRPSLITEIASYFGSQCVVVSIDCKKEKDGTEVMINNQIAKVFGRVSMDLTTIDVSNIDNCSVGDWCEFFSKDMPISNIAKSNSLISYYMMTSVKSRVKKIYKRAE